MVDLSNAFKGLATGAGLGAAAGNPLAIGGGALLGGLSGLLGFGKSKPAKIKEYNPYNANQTEMFDELIQGARAGNKNALEFLNNILSQDPETMKQFEQPYMNQFQTEILPNILERLNMGDNKYSSEVTNSATKAGGNLQAQLAKMRGDLGLQATQLLQGYTDRAATRLKQPYIRGGSPGFWDQTAGATGQGANELFRLLGEWLNR